MHENNFWEKNLKTNTSTPLHWQSILSSFSKKLRTRRRCS